MRLATVFTVCMAMAGLAFAQNEQATTDQPLTAQELRAAIIGIDMVGTYVTEDGRRWRECIAADSSTVYLFEGAQPDSGRLTLTDNDEACFSYVSSNFTRTSCFRVYRDGNSGLRFIGLEGLGDPFIAKQLRRVRTCDHLMGPGA